MSEDQTESFCISAQIPEGQCPQGRYVAESNSSNNTRFNAFLMIHANNSPQHSSPRPSHRVSTVKGLAPPLCPLSQQLQLRVSSSSLFLNPHPAIPFFSKATSLSLLSAFLSCPKNP